MPLVNKLKKIIKNIIFDNEPEPIEIIEKSNNLDKIFSTIKPYTMTNEIRLWSMYQSVKWIVSKKINGDVVETGCWRGGNLFLVGLLKKKIFTDEKIKRKIFGFDTFTGMPIPDQYDYKHQFNLKNTLKRFKKYNKNIKTNWAYTDIKNVRENWKKLINNNDLVLIKGKVEDVLLNKNNLPKKIAILRIDTNFYKSTFASLKYLEPLVQKNGVIIFDDYGSWNGAKKAIDEYYKNKNVWLHRVDRGSRLIIKNY